jgi:hypothetical protein
MKYFKYKKSYAGASCQELLAVCIISYIELYDYKGDTTSFNENATDELLKTFNQDGKTN